MVSLFFCEVGVESSSESDRSQRCGRKFEIVEVESRSVDLPEKEMTLPCRGRHVGPCAG